MNLFAVLVILVAIFGPHGLCSEIDGDKAKHSAMESREKRALYYPYNSAVAFAVVLAIPLSLKNRNVYMSYNFETNYYLPYFDTNQGLVPLPFATIDEPGVNAGTFNDPNRQRNLEDGTDSGNEAKTNSTIKSTVISSAKASVANVSPEGRKSQADEEVTKNENDKKNSRKERQILDTLMSRKKFYSILMDKMEKAGFNGEECLFKAICEAAEQPFGDENGVLGDIVHIIFSPSTSRNENLSKEYYKAERDGHAGLCYRYETFCPVGILELITETFVK